MEAVAYLRVSSREQGKSGLGLEAQRATIENFTRSDGELAVVEWFTEIETGKRVSDTEARRPQLTAALKLAKTLGGPIVVAKLDRLSRDVHYISGLMVHKVPFICCDLGRKADPFMLHIYAAFAEQEREMISKRTIFALQALKRRGVKLGSGSPQIGARIAAERRRSEAAAYAQTIRPHVGDGSWRTKADRLNAAGFRTSTGKLWNPGSLCRLLSR